MAEKLTPVEIMLNAYWTGCSYDISPQDRMRAALRALAENVFVTVAQVGAKMIQKRHSELPFAECEYLAIFSMRDQLLFAAEGEPSPDGEAA